MGNIEGRHLTSADKGYKRRSLKRGHKVGGLDSSYRLSWKRLSVGIAATAGAAALIFFPNHDSGSKDKTTSSEASRGEIKTTPVTLLDGTELFRFDKSAGLLHFTPGAIKANVEAGYDPQKAQVVEGVTNIGPLLHPKPGQDRNGTEPYAEIKMPDGSFSYTPVSNIGPSQKAS